MDDHSFIREVEEDTVNFNRVHDLFHRTGWEDVVFILEEALKDKEALDVEPGPARRHL